VGKGASRRLRRQKRVPAVIYGGRQQAQSLTLSHDEIWRKLQFEAFFSHVLTLHVDGRKKETAVLRDLQRHPFKQQIQHLDFQRVVKDQEIHMQVPLHFLNEAESVGVRGHGGEISHLLTEVDVFCYPQNLPEYIEVDLAQLDIGDVVHLSDLQVPEGVRIVALTHGEEYDAPVASCHHPRVTAAEEEAEAEAEADAGVDAGAAAESAGEGQSSSTDDASADDAGEDSDSDQG
jgi:large subunit ribosomal protein L25